MSRIECLPRARSFGLNLRIDNADARLTPIGRRVGLVTDEHWERIPRSSSANRTLAGFGRSAPHRCQPSILRFAGDWNFARDQLLQVCLRRPEIHMEELIAEGVLKTEALRREDIVSIETSIKYEGYLKQQEREVEKLRKAESKRIPAELDYAQHAGLVARDCREIDPNTSAVDCSGEPDSWNHAGLDFNSSVPSGNASQPAPASRQLIR